MDNILNQKTRSFFDEVDLFKQMENTFESIKTKEKYVSPFYAENSIKPGQNIVTDKPISDFNSTGIDEKGNEGHSYMTYIWEEESGTSVYNRYKQKNSTLNPYHLNFFFEKLNSDRLFNFSGKLCLFDIGNAFYDNLIANYPEGIEHFYGNKKEPLLVNSLESQVQYIKKAVDYHYKGNNLSELEIYEALQLAINYKSTLGKVSSVIFSINDVWENVINDMAKSVASVKIEEYRYLANQNGYNPLLGGSEPFKFILEISLSSAQNIIFNGLKFLKGIVANVLPEGYKKIIEKFDAFTAQINQTVASIKKTITNIADDVLKLTNAFLCGLINGLLSLIEFLLQAIAFLIGFRRRKL